MGIQTEPWRNWNRIWIYSWDVQPTMWGYTLGYNDRCGVCVCTYIYIYVYATKKPLDLGEKMELEEPLR